MEDSLFGKPARNFAPRTIWTGDNLDILRGINSEADCARHELKQSAVVAGADEALMAWYQGGMHAHVPHPLPELKKLNATCCATACECKVDKMHPGIAPHANGGSAPAVLPGHCWRKCEGSGAPGRWAAATRRSMTPVVDAPAPAPAPRVPGCTVCEHQDLAAIDELLRAGESQRGIASRFGLSKSSLNRHAQHAEQPSREA